MHFVARFDCLIQELEVLHQYLGLTLAFVFQLDRRYICFLEVSWVELRVEEARLIVCEDFSLFLIIPLQVFHFSNAGALETLNSTRFKLAIGKLL